MLPPPPPPPRLPCIYPAVLLLEGVLLLECVLILEYVLLLECLPCHLPCIIYPASDLPVLFILLIVIIFYRVLFSSGMWRLGSFLFLCFDIERVLI
jgi:hypothetical protein